MTSVDPGSVSGGIESSRCVSVAGWHLALPILPYLG